MKAAYAKYRLNFIVPGGTSRGVLTYKDTYFLKIWEPEEPERFGIGECALFKGLSAEDDDTYEAKLQELCRNISMGQGTDLVGYSSIMFGFETAILDYSNGCQSMLYPTLFCTGKYAIPINGLVWMGSKEEMQARMEEKLAAGFKTIKIKACNVTIKMWNNAQGTLSTHWIHQRGSKAIRIKIISPAYMFPKSRKPKEIGFDNKETPSKIRFIGANTQ